MAENADGKIGDVVGQCVSDIKQRIERSEKQNPSSSPRCSMEESRTEKTFHQQQISQLEV
nr:hypothetical protein [Wolbachia pipientis]